MKDINKKIINELNNFDIKEDCVEYAKKRKEELLKEKINENNSNLINYNEKEKNIEDKKEENEEENEEKNKEEYEEEYEEDKEEKLKKK